MLENMAPYEYTSVTSTFSILFALFVILIIRYVTFGLTIVLLSRLNYSFILQDKQLEVVEKFSYLGIIFKYNGTFFDTKKKLVDQGQRSLHFIYKTIRNESIPVDLQLKNVDSMIEPILLYGSEVWGYENLKILEQIHLKFCKRILKVRNTTPNFIVYGELCRFPL